MGGWALPVLGRRGLREASGSRPEQPGCRCGRATRPSRQPLAGVPLSLAGSSRHSRPAGSRRRKPPPGLRRARRTATRAATAARHHHRSFAPAPSGMCSSCRPGIGFGRDAADGSSVRMLAEFLLQVVLTAWVYQDARRRDWEGDRFADTPFQVGARRPLPVVLSGAGVPPSPRQASAETDRGQSTVGDLDDGDLSRSTRSGRPPVREADPGEPGGRRAATCGPSRRAGRMHTVRTTSGVRTTCSRSAAVFGRLVAAVASGCPRHRPRR